MNAQDYLEGHWIKNKVWKRLELPVHQERLRRCAEAVKGGRTFVDVGCGLGHSTAILRRFCPGEWTGVEFYDRAVQKASEIFPDIRFIKSLVNGDIAGFGTFDGVVCSEVIEHVEKPDDLIRMIWRITGKRLVVTTPCVKVKDPGHLRLYDVATLAAVFKGLRKVKIERSKRFFYILAER